MNLRTAEKPAGNKRTNSSRDRHFSFDSRPHVELSGSHQRDVWFNVTGSSYQTLDMTPRPLHGCMYEHLIQSRHRAPYRNKSCLETLYNVRFYLTD